MTSKIKSSKSCIHGRNLYSSSRTLLNIIKQSSQSHIQLQNIFPAEFHRQLKQLDPKTQLFNQKMKELIAKNYHYFQNKIKICCQNKPNNYKLKIPSQTGNTTYKNEYLKRNNSTDANQISSPPFKKTHFPFSGQSTYHNSYVPHQIASKSKIRNKNQFKQNNSPTFMETSYKQSFLNWGGKNSITSLKPASNPATSGMPFEGKSVYKSDFNQKDIHPNSKITHQSSFPKFSNISMPFCSSYTNEFTPKKVNKQKNCKPNNGYFNNGLGLKGNTQYRGQFNQMKDFIDCSWKNKTVEEMQDLMMSI